MNASPTERSSDRRRLRRVLLAVVAAVVAVLVLALGVPWPVVAAAVGAFALYLALEG